MQHPHLPALLSDPGGSKRSSTCASPAQGCVHVLISLSAENSSVGAGCAGIWQPSSLAESFIILLHL